jgi:hypothetical protein
MPYGCMLLPAERSPACPHAHAREAMSQLLTSNRRLVLLQTHEQRTVHTPPYKHTGSARRARESGHAGQ